MARLAELTYRELYGILLYGDNPYRADGVEISVDIKSELMRSFNDVLMEKTFEERNIFRGTYNAFALALMFICYKADCIAENGNTRVFSEGHYRDVQQLLELTAMTDRYNESRFWQNYYADPAVPRPADGLAPDGYVYTKCALGGEPHDRTVTKAQLDVVFQNLDVGANDTFIQSYQRMMVFLRDEAAYVEAFNIIGRALCEINIEETDDGWRLADYEDDDTDNEDATDANDDDVVDLNSVDWTINEKTIIDMILGESRQVILTGAPGTGKTFSASRIASVMGGKLPCTEDMRYKFVQFHPSYDYTDFIEGLRPVENEDGSSYSFKKVDGTFKKFCREVVAKNNEEMKKKGKVEKLYFFIIDEINRADLSKVFGELMFCIEKDKRGASHRVETQYNNLKTHGVDEDCYKSGFFIPENVVIIGTMNDIDRSVESMDFALRRRFEWMEFVVDKDILVEAFSSKYYGPVINNYAEELAESLDNMNQIFLDDEYERLGLNEQYFISQGLFANLPKRLYIVNKEDGEEVNVGVAGNEAYYSAAYANIKEYCYKKRIAPMLKEYLRGVEKDIMAEFLEACEKEFMA